MSARGAEAALLVGLALGWGFLANALREEPLPLRGDLDPPPPKEAGADLPSASIEEAADAWRGGAFFLDIRDPASFEERRVAGALSLPADDFESRYFDVVLSLDPEAPMYVYGAAADSFEVRHIAGTLRERGHMNVSPVVCEPDQLFGAGVDSAQGPEAVDAAEAAEDNAATAGTEPTS